MSLLTAKFALKALPAVIAAVPKIIDTALPLVGKTVETGLNLIGSFGEAAMHNVKAQGNLVNALGNMINAHADRIRGIDRDKSKEEEEEKLLRLAAVTRPVLPEALPPV